MHACNSSDFGRLLLSSSFLFFSLGLIGSTGMGVDATASESGVTKSRGEMRGARESGRTGNVVRVSTSDRIRIKEGE